MPSYDALYGAAVSALGLAERPLERILDLGAGTGLLTGWIAAAHPQASFTLLDASAAMLAEARTALGEEARYVTADLTDELPAGPWDAVVSALAIHHIADADKRDLVARVHAALSPGGVFVNAEHVAAPTPALEAHYAEWHERRAAELGATAAEWAGGVQRMGYDRLATLADQLAWLGQAGFADVDCLFKDHRFAVLAGRRASV